VFLGALSALIIMTALSAIMGIVLPAIMSRKYTHFLASLLFFYFGLKLLHDSREMQVRSDEKRWTAGAKRQQKHYTTLLHNEQPSTRRFAPRLTYHPNPFTPFAIRSS